MRRRLSRKQAWLINRQRAALADLVELVDELVERGRLAADDPLACQLRRVADDADHFGSLAAAELARLTERTIALGDPAPSGHHGLWVA